MVIILMISAKMANLGLLKLKLFWNKGYDIIVSVYDATKNFLSCDSNYFVDVVMRPKLDNSSIFKRKVIVTSTLQGFAQKNDFFEGWSWFKFNNLGLALGMALRFYTSVAKGSKLKVRKFFGLILTFVKVTA